MLATFGELHPGVLRRLDLAAPAVAFELDLDALPQPKARPTKARPALEPLALPAGRPRLRLPGRSRRRRPTACCAPIRAPTRQLIREVRLFDVYEGKGVPEGKKSLAVAVRLQAADRTLTDAEIEEVAARIVAAAEKATGAVLR